LVDEALRNRERRNAGYRERALKLFPHICAHCGRDFGGRNLKELTVHHKDHNHDNNPPDGSNWELLCAYCHENEHARNQVADSSALESSSASPLAPAAHRPFADLDKLLKKVK
jgi:5-methylcytosine-specific restriction endonuclease McrA